MRREPAEPEPAYDDETPEPVQARMRHLEELLARVMRECESVISSALADDIIRALDMDAPLVILEAVWYVNSDQPLDK